MKTTDFLTESSLSVFFPYLSICPIPFDQEHTGHTHQRWHLAQVWPGHGLSALLFSAWGCRAEGLSVAVLVGVWGEVGQQVGPAGKRHKADLGLKPQSWAMAGQTQSDGPASHESGVCLWWGSDTPWPGCWYWVGVCEASQHPTGLHWPTRSSLCFCLV